MAKIFANNVGSTRITATYKDGNVTVTDFVDISVIKTAGNLTAAIYNHRTFNGSAQDIATMESYTGNYYFGLGSGTGTNNAPETWGPANTKLQATNAGTYYVWAKCDESTNYNAVSAKYIGTVTISKRNVTVTAPTKTTSALSYNGYAQTLASGGVTKVTNNTSTTVGTMYYYVSTSSTAPTTFSTSTWKTTATAINAGSYYIWYYADVDTANNDGTGLKTITSLTGSTPVVISKRKVTATAPTVTDRTYSGSPQTIFTAGSSSSGGVMYYSDTYTSFSTSSSSWKTTMPYTQKTNAGDYTIYWYCYVADTNNNQQSGGGTINQINSVTATISKKSTSAPILTAGGGSSVVYDSTKSYTATAVNATDNPAGRIWYYGPSSGRTKYSITASTTATKLDQMSRKDVGTTIIHAYFAPNDSDNYASSADATTTVTVGIQADLSIAKTNYSGTYDGSKHVSSIKITNSDWTGKTIVKGTTSSYGTTVTESGVANTAYELYSSTDAVPTTTTIYYKVTGDNNYKDATGSVTFLMNKKDGYLKATTTNRTYTGSAQDIATIESNTGNYYFGFGKGTSSTDGPSSWTNNVNTKLQATNAGTYYVWAKCDESTNYKAVSAIYIGTVTIAKRDVTVTAPTVSNKTFNGTISTPNGSPQTIFGAGSSTEGGVMYYSETDTAFSTSSSSWKTTMPYTQKTNAGTYTIYWYCYVSDTSNNQQESGGGTINTKNSVTATISKANAVLPTTWSGDSKVYHNGPAVLTISGYYGGTVYYRYDKSGGTNWSTSSTTQPTRPDSDGVGSTSVQCMIKGDSNHNDTSWSSAVTLTITAAKDVRHTFTLASDLTYTGSAQKLIIGTDVHGGTIQVGLGTSGTVAPTNWSSTYMSITGTNAGTYYIWYKFTHDAEHDSSTDVSATYVGSVTIGRKTGYLEASTINRTFNGTATNNAGSAQDIATIKNSSGDYYFGLGSSESVGPTTWGSKNTPLQATDAGTYYVWAKCDTSTNYKAVSATYIGTVTISRAAGDISFTANTTSFSFYCTTNAETATTTLANNDLTISTAGATSGTGTVSVTANNGWSVLNNGKTLSVPIGTAGETGAGKTYTITVTATAAATSNFNAASKSATITVVVKSQVLERIEFKVKNAKTATLKYGESSTDVSVIAYYSSGDTAKKDVTSDAEYTYSISNIATVNKYYH